MENKQWWNISHFVSPSYLDINPVVAILIENMFHKNVLKFQVAVHYVCRWESKDLTFSTSI